MIVTVFLCFFLHFVGSTPLITLYADVFKDREFFQKTFPWIIDHIGGEITVEFHLLGSGRYSIPQMCALKDLSSNTFLQAQYLKCEVEGNPSAYCLCETGIDPERFKECVNDGGYLASVASSRFMMLGLGTTPLIELGPKSTIFEVSAPWYLRKICTIFGDHPPMGCTKTCSSCSNDTEPYEDKKALAQFDKECRVCPDHQTTLLDYTTTTATTPYTYK